MDEQTIIKLFQSRDEAALTQAQRAYGTYCRRIAQNILADAQDADECVNDALLQAWQALEHETPTHLKAYLAKITRNLALNRLKALQATKRGSGTADAVLDELAQVLPAADNVEDEALADVLASIVEAFLRQQPPRDCAVFLARYFNLDTYAVIAARHGLSEPAVRVSISRTRKKLKLYLKQEGWIS